MNEPEQSTTSEDSQPTETQIPIIQICSICREKNLTDSVEFNNCARCNQVYCLHYASSIDPAYCTECLHNVSVIEEIIVKKQEFYNEATDQVYTRTRKAKKITIGGMHWLFQARRIKSLTDLELGLSIEYHQDILTNLLYERDERKVQKFHRNAGKKVGINFDKSGSVTEQIDSTVTVKKTRTKTATKVDPQAQLLVALQMLKNSGFSPEAIAKMAVSGKK